MYHVPEFLLGVAIVCNGQSLYVIYLWLILYDDSGLRPRTGSFSPLPAYLVDLLDLWYSVGQSLYMIYLWVILYDDSGLRPRTGSVFLGQYIW